MGVLQLSNYTDVGVLISVTSFVSYIVWKRYEPKKLPALHLIVPTLILIPGALTAVLSASPLFASLLQATTLAYVSYYAEILAYMVAYRLSPFHPLAKYPGPFLAKISKIVMMKTLGTGKQHLIIQSWHNKYGDVVRIGPNELSIRNADAVLPVLALPKGPFWDNRSDPPSLIATRDLALHAQKRRRWNRAFSIASLKAYEEIIQDHGKEFIDTLTLHSKQFLDLTAWMSYFTFDFMGELCFGRGFSMVKDGKDKGGLLPLIEGAVAFETVAAHIPWAIPLFHKLPIAAESEHRLVEFGVGNVQYRMKNVSGRRDLFHYLIDEDGLEPEKPSTGTIISDALVSIIAGSDTTAIALTSLFYFLMRNADATQRLRSEISKEFPIGQEPIDFSRLARMEYLNACINETVRLIPPLPGGAQKYVLRGTGGKMAGPFFIPEGTAITVHPYSLHRDERYFSLPDLFWPDRWLPSGERKYPEGLSEKTFVLNKAAYIPFSGGAASCPGKSLALMELRAVSYLMLQHFDVQPADKDACGKWEDTLEDWFDLVRGALPVKLTPRDARAHGSSSY